ncbi:MAG: Gfo/Idh/MocA family oxidoreductase [bacterium]
MNPGLFYKPLDARSLIDANEIGRPVGLRIDATIGKSMTGVWNFDEGSPEAWRFDSDLAGGTPMLYDIGYQSMCIALFLIGSIEKIEVWQSLTKINDQLAIDAPTTAMWKHFQQDVFGTLALTYAPERKMRTPYQPIEMRITINGTRGDIEILRNSDPAQLEAPVELRRDARKVIYGQKNTAFEDSFYRATRNFVSGCLGEEEPLLKGNEGKQLLILTLAYQEAVRRGRAVSLQAG